MEEQQRKRDSSQSVSTKMEKRREQESAKIRFVLFVGQIMHALPRNHLNKHFKNSILYEFLNC